LQLPFYLRSKFTSEIIYAERINCWCTVHTYDIQCVHKYSLGNITYTVQHIYVCVHNMLLPTDMRAIFFQYINCQIMHDHIEINMTVLKQWMSIPLDIQMYLLTCIYICKKKQCFFYLLFIFYEIHVCEMIYI
jgi:hypothetical protein